MALRPGIRYSGQTETGDPAYPLGKARNASAFGDGTGTPLEKDWLNDDWGFKQALLAAAEIEASGDPDAVGASQYLDAVRAISLSATSGRHLRSLMQARRIDLDGVTPSTDPRMGAVGMGAFGNRVFIVKGDANGVFQLADTSIVATTGSTAPLSDCRGVAFNGTNRFVAIGNGGTSGNAFSSGGGWTAGGAFPGGFGIPGDIVWDGTEFIVVASSDAVHSTNAVAWTAPVGQDVGGALGTSCDGLAVHVPGVVLAIGPMGVVAKTTNHGAVWVEATTIPTLISNPAFCRIVGDGSGETLAFIKDGFGSLVECWVTTDAGDTWTKRSEFDGHDDGTLTVNAVMCQDTGLVVYETSSNPMRVSASVDRGRTWSPLAFYYDCDGDTLRAAMGRIIVGGGSRIFATDPIM